MNKSLQQGKMYYSISEVAEMIGVVPYVLRFWEKEFPNIKPRKNRAGNRAYQTRDIERIMQIKKLLYEEGYTIEGARNYLKREGKGAIPAETPADSTASAIPIQGDKELLCEIRRDVEELLKLFP
jgi:DNA-binding transcriptional MerR regulator